MYPDVTDYASAAAAFTAAEAKPRFSGQVKVGNNTYLARSGPGLPVYAIRLHATDVLRFYPDGTIVAATGGWNTVTTRKRLNRHTPPRFAFHTKAGTLYITDRPAAGNPVTAHEEAAVAFLNQHAEPGQGIVVT